MVPYLSILWFLSGLSSAFLYYAIVRRSPRLQYILPTHALDARQTLVDVGLMILFGPVALFSLLAFIIKPPDFRVIGWSAYGIAYGETGGSRE